jgi:hypothetical protein
VSLIVEVLMRAVLAFTILMLVMMFMTWVVTTADHRDSVRIEAVPTQGVPRIEGSR